MNRSFLGALLGSCLVFSLFAVPTVSAQLSTADDVTESDYRIYHSDGTPATMDDVRAALKQVDVVFVGELHNDPVSHFIEERVLEGWFEAHGHAATLSLEMGAFSRDAETGMYSADYDKMIEAMNALTEKILRFQGDGDYEGVAAFVADYARVPQQLQADLDRLAEEGIPVDIVFEQGLAAVGR